MRSQAILHFSGLPYIGRIARLSLRQHGFLVMMMIDIYFYQLYNFSRRVTGRTRFLSCSNMPQKMRWRPVAASRTPLCELTALPQTPTWISRGPLRSGKGKAKGRLVGERWQGA